MNYLYSKKAKYKPPGDVNMKEFTDDNQATLVQSTSKSFMQSEEDLATFEPSEHVQTSGAMEHQGGQFVTCTMFTSLEHPLLFLLHSVMDRLKSVPVAVFSAHVRSMHQDRDKGFEREYQVRSFLGSCACHYFFFSYLNPPRGFFDLLCIRFTSLSILVI